MADRLIVAEAGTLFEVLARHFADGSKHAWSKKTLRQRLRFGCIDVNGHTTTRHSDPVKPGDVVEIHATSAGRVTKRAAVDLPVLFDDEHLLAIDKPLGLLSVGSDEERQRTALVLAREAASRPGRAVALWPIHRLDRETSGVLLFARSRAVRDQLQKDWSNTVKVYVAIVEGLPDPAAGTIEQPLWEDQNLRVRVGARPGAKQARTRYQTTHRGPCRSQLEVHLDTGRKHQIRAHLAWLGHPIVGDDRYGTSDVRLCLHAQRLVVRHPTHGQDLCIEAPLPPVLPRALTQR